MDRYQQAQRLAYDAAIAVATALAPGVTERDAAARLEEALHARGVRRWFHAPFAWFGERTRFAGFEGAAGRARFFPSDARLELGMIAILDVAPIVDGCVADIGYTFACGEAPALDRAMHTLDEVRALIPARVDAGDTMRAIYRAVDDVFARAGYDTRHALYPFGVLGHRVGKPLDAPGRIAGFGLGAIAQLLGGQLASRVSRVPSPLWTADADRPPRPGLWSMEPHLGGEGWGAKFEELLVVDDRGRARWLDDDLPHVR